MNFNLIDERWIPVLYADGRFERVGIRAALTEAGRIRQIAASNPMDNVALLRFLLAILYWCRGNPKGQEEQQRLAADQRFPADWFAKLEQHRDCFNLLGNGKRLYQTVTAKRSRPTTELLQEIPTGNNFWHFRHSTDGQEGLCASCCAIGLLRLPLFSVSGLPDLKAGINGTPPIYIVPIGGSLLHTLCLHWISRESPGAPTWESDTGLPEGKPVPLLNGLTTLSRRVWLHAFTPPRGNCIGCGQEQPSLIRTCEYQSAGEKQSDNWIDPHVIYVEKKSKDGALSRKALTAPDLTKSSFRLDRPWASLIAETASSNRFRHDSEPLQLLMVGFATDKAKNIDVWERRCTIPAFTETDGDGSATAKTIRAWDEHGAKLAARMRPKDFRSRGVQYITATAAIRPQVESQGSGRICTRLADPDQAWPEAVGEYRRMNTIVSTTLSPGFTVRALRRRKEIARTLPDMTPKPAANPRRSKETQKGGSE